MEPALVPVNDDGKFFSAACYHGYSGQSMVPSIHLINNVHVPEDRNVG